MTRRPYHPRKEPLPGSSSGETLPENGPTPNLGPSSSTAVNTRHLAVRETQPTLANSTWTETSTAPSNMTSPSSSAPGSKSSWHVGLRSLRSTFANGELEHQKLQAFTSNTKLRTEAASDRDDRGEAEGVVEGVGEADVKRRALTAQAQIRALEAKLEEREALARGSSRTSINGVKLDGGQRARLENNRDKILSQVTLCRAAVRLGDLTTAWKVHGCSTRFILIDPKEKKASYFDEHAKDPGYTVFACGIGPCHFCGGDRDRVERHIKLILNARSSPDAPRNYERPKSDFHYLRFSSFKLGGPLVDGVYKALNDAIKAITESGVFDLFFDGASLDTELFDKHHEVLGHFTAVGPIKEGLRRSRRRELLTRMGDFWAERVPGGEFFEEPLRKTLARALSYDAKGFAPAVKNNPHLGQPIEQMEALLKLSLGFNNGVLGRQPHPEDMQPGDVSRARYHWGLGAWRQGKLTSPSGAKGDTAHTERKRKPKKPKAPRREIRSEAQLQELMRGRVHIPGRVLNDDNGKRFARARLVAVTESVAVTVLATAPAPLGSFPDLSPDGEQEAIAERMRSGAHVVIAAVAGWGKSEAITRQLKANRERRTLGVAFGVDAAAELKSRLPPYRNLTVSTLHALFLRGWNEHLGREVEINDDKVRDIASMVAEPADVAEVVRLVKVAKANLLLPDDDLSALGGVDAATEGLVRDVLRRSNNIEHEIDFDDMIYLPQVADIVLPEFDLVAVDELQDLTLAQVMGALRLGRSAQIIGVGDRHQSSHEFRGAMADAIGEMAARLGVEQMSMRYTRRCPKRVVEEAQGYVPHIRAMPGAPDGWVRYFGDELRNPRLFRPGDMILCRYRDVLVRLADRLKDIGRRPNLMFSPGAESEPARGSSSSPRGYRKDRINLATVHAAKGSAAPRVFFIKVPSRHGMDRVVHVEQHNNLDYIAITRAAEGVAFLTP